ncbi:MAG: BatA domain-containing protein [Bacteroidetes bacterium]|nr:BatA domain-containing protein [Bacteroidota bacterium]
MHFLYPSFLWALSLISIPIIIHLFNFRRYKKIYFSNVSLLKEVKEETKSVSRLKHLLVLLSRILAVACLVIAFAQPYIPSNNNTTEIGTNFISIYIDNSFSMETSGKTGNLLNEAKKKASEIIKSYRNTDRFQLLTNDFEGKHQNFYTKEEAVTMVDEITSSSSSKLLSDIFTRSNAALANVAGTKKKYIISDFQKSIANIASLKNDTLAQSFLLPIKAENKNNLYIDSCWFTEPIQNNTKKHTVIARIKNVGTEPIENASINLFINSQLKTPVAFSVKENEAVDIQIPFSSKEVGMQEAYLEITDNPVTFDDRLYFSFTIQSSIPVLEIVPNKTDLKNKSNIQSVFTLDSLFAFESYKVSEIDYSKLPKYSLIILHQLPELSTGLQIEIKKCIENGASVLIIPANTIDLSSYNSFLQQIASTKISAPQKTKLKANWINYAHFMYEGVFEKKSENLNLPFVELYYPIEKNTLSNEEQLLRLENGASLLSIFTGGKGKIYLLTTSLDETSGNMAKHALFVPTLYQIALNSSNPKPIYYTLGANTGIECDALTSTNKMVYKIKSSNESNPIELIPEFKQLSNSSFLYPGNTLAIAGNYNIMLENITVQKASFNYSRKESQLEFYSSDELTSELAKNNLTTISLLNAEKNVQTIIREISIGQFYWKYFLIAALICLAIEIILIRLLK